MELFIAFLFVIVAVFCIVWSGIAYGIVGKINMITLVLGLFSLTSMGAAVYLVLPYMHR